MLETLKKVATEKRTLRRVALPLYKGTMRCQVFGRPPRVLINSIPKAGTHLVSSLMDHLPAMRYSGHHHSYSDFIAGNAPSVRVGEDVEVSWHRLEKELAKVRMGQYATSHFHYERELTEIVNRLDFRVVFVLRDPRDIIVSSTHYITRSPRHVLHHRFIELGTLGRRIDAVINGLDPSDTGPGLEPISVRLRRYDNWVHASSVLLCRFEDLVGQSGGGSPRGQLDLVHRLASFAGRPLSDWAAGQIALRVWSPRSRTFRAGRVGGWQEAFSRQQERAVADAIGDLAARWGYHFEPGDKG